MKSNSFCLKPQPHGLLAHGYYKTTFPTYPTFFLLQMLFYVIISDMQPYIIRIACIPGFHRHLLPAQAVYVIHSQHTSRLCILNVVNPFLNRLCFFLLSFQCGSSSVILLSVEPDHAFRFFRSVFPVQDDAVPDSLVCLRHLRKLIFKKPYFSFQLPILIQHCFCHIHAVPFWLRACSSSTYWKLDRIPYLSATLT